MKTRMIRIWKWMKRPNSSPNGIILTVATLLITICFGTAFGLKELWEDFRHDTECIRAEGRNGIRLNFTDLYDTIDEVTDDTDLILAGLRMRMDKRTPELSENGC